MSAQFPGAVKTFTTKNAGDVIQPVDINDLQDEVNAIEDGYVNGTARLNSSNSTLRALSVTAGSTLTTLQVTGGSTLTGLQVNGNSTLGSTVTFGTIGYIFPASAPASSGLALMVTSTGSPNTLGWGSISGSLSVLLATSGTDANAAATDFATVAISGLTQKDSLRVVMRLNSQTQATAGPFPRNSTDAVNLTVAGAALVAGLGKVYTFDIFCDPFSTLKVLTQKYEADAADALITAAFINRANVVTAWTGAWTLALRHGGVTAGGTLNYSVTVYKLAGQ